VVADCFENLVPSCQTTRCYISAEKSSLGKVIQMN